MNGPSEFRSARAADGRGALAAAIEPNGIATDRNLDLLAAMRAPEHIALALANSQISATLSHSRMWTLMLRLGVPLDTSAMKPRPFAFVAGTVIAPSGGA